MKIDSSIIGPIIFIITLCWLTPRTSHGQSLQVAGVKDPVIWMSTKQHDAAALMLHIQGAANQTIQPREAEMLNFHPTFNVNELAIGAHALDLQAATVFCVVQPQTSHEEAIWKFEKNAQPAVLATSHRLADLENFEFINLLNRNPSKPYFANYFQHLNRPDSGAAFSFVLGPDPKDIPIKPLQSGVAELVVFDRVISPKEKSIIDSYLAIKYGISLPQTVPTNYYNSDHFVIWDAKKNRSYSNGVVAIGRNETVNLHQKQAQAEALVISAGHRAPSNATNPYELPDNSYLFWSHDGKSLTWNEDQGSTSRRLERTWLAAVDDAMRALPTQVHLREENLQVDKRPDEIWWLDYYPSQSDQTLAHLEAYAFSSESAGEWFVDGLKWDQDQSGNDIFMITAGPPFRVEYQITESPCDSDSAAIALKIFGGKAPYKITLHGRDQSQSLSRIAESSFAEINALKAGIFTLEVTDQTALTFKEDILISHLDAVPITWPNQWILDADDKLTLDPNIYFDVPLSAKISWILPNLDLVEQTILEAQTAGQHTLMISVDNCYSAQPFEILEGANGIIKNVTLFPNPMAAGSTMKAQVKLKHPTTVDIELVNVQGQQIQRWQLSGKEEYWVEHVMRVAGSYFLNVRSLHQLNSTPFLVQ